MSLLTLSQMTIILPPNVTLNASNDEIVKKEMPREEMERDLTLQFVT